MTEAAQPDPRAYMRLAALIRQQIADGTLTRGARLPSIAVLRRDHGHSRQTVGKAMHVLEDEGLIYRVPGLGYYVTAATAAAHRR
jgi:DNA-binding GntR family transcriptional regulator